MRSWFCACLLCAAVLVACQDDAAAPGTSSGGTGGSAGSGTGGAAGSTGGSAGSTGGSAGSTGGSAGTAGASGGSAGTAGASGGSGGTDAGDAGDAGDASDATTDGQDEGDAASTCTLEIGTGATAFEALTSGQSVTLAAGPQGGYHVWGAARLTGSSNDVVIEYRILDADTRAELGSIMPCLTLTPVSTLPGVKEVTGLIGFVGYDPSPFLAPGKAALLSLHVYDADYATCSQVPSCDVSGEVPVTLVF